MGRRRPAKFDRLPEWQLEQLPLRSVRPPHRRDRPRRCGGETRLAWNSFSVHSDYSGQNQLQTSYVPGPTFGAALEQTSASQTRYYLADGQNNPSALTDGSGQIVGTYAFDSFGVPQTGNASANRYSYGGYQLDSASGLYYAGARYYDPSSGRFLSEDPQAAENPYAYADVDPVDLVDPLGQQAFREYVALITNAVVRTVAFALRVACILLNILTILGVLEFAIDGMLRSMQATRSAKA